MTDDFLKGTERAERGPAGRPVPAEEAVPVFLPENGTDLPDEKEKAAPSVSSESELGKDVALVALAAVGVERNRHYIDEQIMRKARKKR